MSKVNLDSQGSRERFEGRVEVEGGNAKRGNATIDAKRYNEIFQVNSFIKQSQIQDEQDAFFTEN